MGAGLVLALWLLATTTAQQLNFSDPEGVVYSPNYPQNYGNLENQTITIEVASNTYIHLTFLDYYTEDTYDVLHVYEGIGAGAVLIAEYSGEQTGLTLDIQSSTATLRFTSDLTTTFRGFAIAYESIALGQVYTPTNTCPSPLHNPSWSFGIVTSPNWPSNYPDNITCSYLLSAPGKTIQLQFLVFNTETTYDYVCVYDGANNSATLLGEYSGTQSIPVINSTGENLFIYFYSDLTNNYAGFSALYNVVPVGPFARRQVGTLLQPLAAKQRNGGGIKPVLCK